MTPGLSGLPLWDSLHISSQKSKSDLFQMPLVLRPDIHCIAFPPICPIWCVWQLLALHHEQEVVLWWIVDRNMEISISEV